MKNAGHHSHHYQLMEYETGGAEDQPSSPLVEFVGNEDQLKMGNIEYNNGDDKFGAMPTDKTLNLNNDFRDQNRERRILSQLTRPSTTLALESKGNLRHQNRLRLRYLLNKLMKRRHWADAGGVLTVLLQGTCNERSLHNNYIKYSAAMEILGHVESGHAYSKEIEGIYNLWMKKIVPKKNRPWKDKFVLFDSIVSFLMEKNYDGARLVQGGEVENDPISNLILGLCHYELWYTTLPEDRQLIDIHDQEMLNETEESGTELYNNVANSEGYQAVTVRDTNSSFKCLSETSVMNDKVIQMNNLNRQGSLSYADQQREMKNYQSQVQGLYIHSDQLSGSEGGSLMKRNTNRHHSSAFASHGFPDSLLFPIQWDPLNENIEDVLKELQPNDDCKDAVEYLRKALNFTPGVAEALLPLVQILLLNDRVTEALDELEKFSHASKALFASKLKTHYFECLGCKNFEQFCSSYEDILKKDPTCRHAVTKLIRAYQMGDYGPDRLFEMIALHMDAAFADHDIWRELALCLLKVSEYEEDQVSTCLNGEAGGRLNQNKKIPTMFFKGVLGKNWKLRYKWWLNRHFNKKLLASEMAGGDLLLMAYKAACATQIYGPGFYYVVKVGAFLKDEKDPLFAVLSKYVQSSSGFFPGISTVHEGLMSPWEEVFSCVRKMKEGGKTDKERGVAQDKSARKRGRPKAEETRRKQTGRPRKEGKRELEGERVETGTEYPITSHQQKRINAIK
ncbi:hypothetical protein V2J09_016345 [Rumex salicifolius]